MIGCVIDNYCVNFDDFIEVDENLDCSELSLGLLCFEKDTKEYRIFCKHPKTGKLGWAKLIIDIQKGVNNE